MSRRSRTWTEDEAVADALTLHPECSHAEPFTGLNPTLMLTHVIHLWRDEECWLENDPPRHIEDGYLKAEVYGKHEVAAVVRFVRSEAPASATFPEGKP